MSHITDLIQQYKDGVNTNNRMKSSKFLADFYEDRAAELNKVAKDILTQVLTFEEKARALRKELENSEKVDVSSIEGELRAIDEFYINKK
jgi:hypothetical protein